MSTAPHVHHYRLAGDPPDRVRVGHWPPGGGPPDAVWAEPVGGPLPVPDHVPGAAKMVAEPGAAVRPAAVPLPAFCGRLGRRLEFRAGCTSGYGCLWECGSDRPDVAEHLGGVMTCIPAHDCTDCPGFEPGSRPV